jgi:hypothetical protein
MKDEALKLALAALETELAVDMTNGAEVGEAAELMCEAITAIKQALAQPAPVQGLPFGVGGGLVAIKTLLGRDPCVHANTAIEMIDAILNTHPAAQPAVPDAIHHTDTSETLEYIEGWNDCRAKMLRGMK